MRTILLLEMNNERCNAAALGLFNAGAGSMGSNKMTFDEYIQNEEEGDKPQRIKALEVEIDLLEKSIDKMYNTSVTPYSDELAKHFPKGNVGFMGGRGAKIKERELSKTIDHSKKIQAKEMQLKTLQAQLKKEKSGKIIRKNGLSVTPYRTLKEMVVKIPEAIKSKKYNGNTLNSDQINNLKESLSTYKRQLKDREKMYKSKYDNYIK